MVAVFHHESLVGAEDAVVAPGDHLVSYKHPFFADSEPRCSRIEFTSLDASVLS